MSQPLPTWRRTSTSLLFWIVFATAALGLGAAQTPKRGPTPARWTEVDSIDLNGDEIVDCQFRTTFDGYELVNGWFVRRVDLVSGAGSEVLCRRVTNRIGGQLWRYNEPVVLPEGAPVVTNAALGHFWSQVDSMVWRAQAIQWVVNEVDPTTMTNLVGVFSTNSGYIGVRFQTVDGPRIGWLGRTQHVVGSLGSSWQPDRQRGIAAGEAVPPPVAVPGTEQVAGILGPGETIDYTIHRRFTLNASGQKEYREASIEALGGLSVLVAKDSASPTLVVAPIPLRRLLGANPLPGARWSNPGEKVLVWRDSGDGNRPIHTNVFIGFRREPGQLVAWIEMASPGTVVHRSGFHAEVARYLDLGGYSPLPFSPQRWIDLDGDGWTDVNFGSQYLSWPAVSGPFGNDPRHLGWEGFEALEDTVIRTVQPIDWPSFTFSTNYPFLSLNSGRPAYYHGDQPIPFPMGENIPAEPPASNSPPIEPNVRAMARSGEFCLGWSGLTATFGCCGGGGMPDGIIALWMRKADGWHAGWLNLKDPTSPSGESWFVHPKPGREVQAGLFPMRLDAVLVDGFLHLSWTPFPGCRLEYTDPNSSAGNWIEAPLDPGAESQRIPVEGNARLFRIVRR